MSFTPFHPLCSPSNNDNIIAVYARVHLTITHNNIRVQTHINIIIIIIHTEWHEVFFLENRSKNVLGCYEPYRVQ